MAAAEGLTQIRGGGVENVTDFAFEMSLGARSKYRREESLTYIVMPTRASS